MRDFPGGMPDTIWGSEIPGSARNGPSDPDVFFEGDFFLLFFLFSKSNVKLFLLPRRPISLFISLSLEKETAHLHRHRRPPLRGLLGGPERGPGPRRGAARGTEDAQGHCRHRRRRIRRDNAELDEPSPVGGYPGLALLLVCVGRGDLVITVAAVVVEWRHMRR